MNQRTPDHDDVICHRCGALMDPGGPLFYLVRIEAFPLPDAPINDPADDGLNLRGHLAELCEQARHHSPRELMDQVYRKVSLHLCPTCYAPWIEEPAG